MQFAFVVVCLFRIHPVTVQLLSKMAVIAVKIAWECHLSSTIFSTLFTLGRTYQTLSQTSIISIEFECSLTIGFNHSEVSKIRKVIKRQFVTNNFIYDSVICDGVLW